VTIAGKVYSGLVVYRSVDGLLLRDAEQNTYRFEEAEIESQQKRRTSLMPAGRPAEERLKPLRSQICTNT
jgi:hypothetical protein